MDFFKLILLITIFVAVESFEVEYQWSHINYTWRSVIEYNNSIKNKDYIPENNLLCGIKFYKDKLYLATPRIRAGTPVSLSYVSTNATNKTNLLLTPFPSWKANSLKTCDSIQNIHSMEIDANGIMWVLDGSRYNEVTKCPTKLMLLDLNNKGAIIHTYKFDETISSSKGGFLNDLVIEESGGSKFAYITDNSNLDPGLVVYSLAKNKAWKVRDQTMFAELEAADFMVDGRMVNNLGPIDGIAMSPLSNGGDRVIYYSNLIGFKLYSISTAMLKNEDLIQSGQWRRAVKLVGHKSAQSDGLMMDNLGNLYYTLLSTSGIGKWNISTSFDEAIDMEHERPGMVWPDGFGMDLNGNLFVLANGIPKYFDPCYIPVLNNLIKFRIFKHHTGTKSYLYPK